MAKANPILDAFERKLRAEFAQRVAAMEADYHRRLARNTEINLIAMLIGGNDCGFLGPARAGLLLDAQLETKMKIAEELIADSEDDPQLEYTRYDLARRVQQILGPDEWVRCQGLFPLLREYWVKPDGEGAV